MFLGHLASQYVRNYIIDKVSKHNMNKSEGQWTSSVTSVCARKLDFETNFNRIIMHLNSSSICANIISLPFLHSLHFDMCSFFTQLQKILVGTPWTETKKTKGMPASPLAKHN